MLKHIATLVSKSRISQFLKMADTILKYQYD